MVGSCTDELRLVSWGMFGDPGDRPPDPAIPRALEARGTTIDDSRGHDAPRTSRRQDRRPPLGDRDGISIHGTGLRPRRRPYGSGHGTWLYRFDWKSPALGGQLRACHGVDVPFVFDTLDAGTGTRRRRAASVAGTGGPPGLDVIRSRGRTKLCGARPLAALLPGDGGDQGHRRRAVDRGLSSQPRDRDLAVAIASLNLDGRSTHRYRRVRPPTGRTVAVARGSGDTARPGRQGLVMAAIDEDVAAQFVSTLEDWVQPRGPAVRRRIRKGGPLPGTPRPPDEGLRSVRRKHPRRVRGPRTSTSAPTPASSKSCRTAGCRWQASSTRTRSPPP